MMRDVPSGTKNKIQFLLRKKSQDENDEGRAIGYKKENSVFTKRKEKKSQDENDEGRAIGYKKGN